MTHIYETPQLGTKPEHQTGLRLFYCCERHIHKDGGPCADHNPQICEFFARLLGKAEQ